MKSQHIWINRVLVHLPSISQRAADVVVIGTNLLGTPKD